MSFNEIGQIIEGMSWLGITGSLGGPQGFLSEGVTTKSQSTKSTHQSIFAIHVLFEETSLGKREICVVARTLGMEQPRPYPLQCRGSHSFVKPGLACVSA